MKKSYLILIGAIVVAVIVLLIERPEKANKGDFESFKLFEFVDENNISRIEVEHLFSGSLIEKIGNEWKVSEMKTELSTNEEQGAIGVRKFAADAEKVKQVVERFAKMEAKSLVSSNPEKQAVYDVGKLSKRVRLFDSGGKLVADLDVGKYGPDMFSTYVRRGGGNEVYLVGEQIGALISSDVLGWREKGIWDLEPESIQSVNVERQDEKNSFTIVRDEKGSFKLSSPEEKPLDEEKVSQFVNKIAKLDAARFALVVGQAETGFDAPSIKITVTTNEGSRNVLDIGKEDKQGYLFARLEGKGGEVYLLNASFKNEIPEDWKTFAGN